MKALAIPAGALALVGLYLASVALRSGESAHVDVTPWSIGVAFGAALAIAGGTVATWASGRPSLGAIFALAAGLLVLAPLSVFSIGIFVLPVAVLVLVIAIRRLRRDGSPRALPAAVAGVVIGIGALVYLLVLIQPASAECRAGGGGMTSSGGLFSPIARSQGGFSSVGGRQGGYIDEGDQIAFFSCQGAKMTDFHRESLPAGTWSVTTQPAPTVGRSVTIVFRIRPSAGIDPIPADGFAFSATCRTCPEPRPTISGRVTLAQPGLSATPAGIVTFAGEVTFTAAGTWWTSAPFEGPLEVR